MLTQTEIRSPLSSMQRRIWALTQKRPELASFFNLPVVIALRGAVNHEAIENSLNLLLERHPQLRATIRVVDGEPVQSISDHTRATLSSETLPLRTLLSRCTLRRAAVDWCKAFCKVPIDLTQAPLLRACLLRLTAAESWLVVCVNHIAFDGWSKVIFFKDFVRYCAPAAHTDERPPQPLTARYVDYATAQFRDAESAQMRARALQWAERLGAAGRSSLTDGKFIRRSGSLAAEQVTTRIRPEVVGELRRLARDRKTTLAGVLLTCLAMLLARHAELTEFVIGVLFANRRRVEHQNIVGMFVNLVGIRAAVDPQAAFDALLLAIRDELATAFENQDLQFDKVAGFLSPDRLAAGQPLVPVVFNMLPEAQDESCSGDLSATLVTIPPTSCLVDLSLIAQESKRGLDLRLVFRSGSLSTAAATEFLGQFAAAACEAVGSSKAPIHTFLRLTDRRRLEVFRWLYTVH